MAQRFFKQSAALEDYDFDWSGWLVDGDFITSYNVVADDGVTLGDVSHHAGSPIIKQFVGGGTHGNSYKVTCQISTDQGRSDVAQVIILIRDLGIGGQPIAPPLEEDEMTIVTNITGLVSFPQPGVGFSSQPGNSIVALKTGTLVTLAWDMDIAISVPNLFHIEILLPAEYRGKLGFDFASSSSYAVGTTPTFIGPTLIQDAGQSPPLGANDRLAIYASNGQMLPQADIIYMAGQITYATA